MHTKYFELFYTKTITKYPKIDLGIIQGKINIFMQEDRDKYVTDAS